MSPDELSELLQTLPRAKASNHFTARTLSRVREDAATKWYAARTLRFAAVTAAMLVIVIGAAGLYRHEQHERIRAIRTEQQQIQRELDELKVLASDHDPKVFVGSSGPYDLVIDLKKPASPDAAPASVRIADDGAV